MHHSLELNLCIQQLTQTIHSRSVTNTALSTSRMLQPHGNHHVENTLCTHSPIQFVQVAAMQLHTNIQDQLQMLLSYGYSRFDKLVIYEDIICSAGGSAVNCVHTTNNQALIKDFVIRVIKMNFLCVSIIRQLFDSWSCDLGHMKAKKETSFLRSEEKRSKTRKDASFLLNLSVQLYNFHGVLPLKQYKLFISKVTFDLTSASFSSNNFLRRFIYTEWNIDRQVNKRTRK